MGAGEDVYRLKGVIRSITANYSAEIEDLILADATAGSFTVTLPPAALANRVIVKKVDSSANAITIATPGSETIDGASTATISIQYEILTFISDGSNWHIFSEKVPADVANGIPKLDASGLLKLAQIPDVLITKIIDLSENFVGFPRKATSGFGGSGTYYDKGFRDGVLIGGCWLAKYPMSRLDATPKDQGSSSIPVSQPRVPAWTDINWQQALEACRLMNRSDEQALAKAYVSGGGIGSSGDVNGYHYITIDTAAHFLELAVGNHIELAHTLTAAEVAQMNTNNYDNAIHTNTTTAPVLRLGSSNQWVEGDIIIYERKVAKFDQVNKKIYLTMPLPTDALSIADITATSPDTLSVRKYDLAGLEEWAAIKLECAMQAKAGSPFGADGYPKGNNNYGRDSADADEWKYYGDNDPTFTTAGHPIVKVLCGSGPDSWYHNNNRKTGVWCYNGNVYDWLNAKVYDRKIQAGYPGEGHTFPAANNHIATIEAAATLCGAKDLALPITVGASCAQFGGDYGYFDYAGDRFLLVGGSYSETGYAGVFYTDIISVPTDAYVYIGFRAAL